MIHNETNLEVADNSGARRVQCIKVLGGSKRKFASVGDIIIVSIKEAIPKGKVSKGKVVYGLEFFLMFQYLKNLLKLEWVKEKVLLNIGHVESSQEEYYLSSMVLTKV